MCLCCHRAFSGVHPASILNDMRLSKIPLLSLMTYAPSNICDYMELMNLNDIVRMFDLISNAFAVAVDGVNSWYYLVGQNEIKNRH